MTEIPSVLFTAIALTVHLRGIQQRPPAAGRSCLVDPVNLRETVGLYAVWLVIAPFVGGYKPSLSNCKSRVIALDFPGRRAWAVCDLVCDLSRVSTRLAHVAFVYAG
jgi:hypothetical protein